MAAFRIRSCSKFLRTRELALKSCYEGSVGAAKISDCAKRNEAYSRTVRSVCCAVVFAFRFSLGAWRGELRVGCRRETLSRSRRRDRGSLSRRRAPRAHKSADRTGQKTDPRFEPLLY